MTHEVYSDISSLLVSNYVRINKQSFLMGSPDSEHDRKDWEVLHKVNLNTFCISKLSLYSKD